MTDSRTRNTIRNISAGLINRAICIVFPFLNRTVILRLLGAEFTGLSGLFASILGILNIAELGFNTAIVYSLYKPMAEKDEQKICLIVSLLRQIYIYVGIFVFVLGMAIMPFLKYLIHDGYPAQINLYALYFLYLINSAISYFMFSYKETLLIADQRKDISQNIRTIVEILRYTVQFLALIIFRNFYIYLIIAIVGTIVTNISIEVVTRKRYPYFHLIKGSKKIPRDTLTRVKGLFINRVCDTLRNGIDNIVISSMIGLTATAIYGNYYYIYSALYGVLLTIVNAMGASIGNSIALKSENENYKDLLKFSAIFSWIMGVCTACLVCIYQPFMSLWVGSDLLLSNENMFLFCIYFYAINMNNIRNQYISGTGMWWHLKKAYILETIGNLVLNIILAKWLGITGVLLATIITIFFFNYLFRNSVLFSTYFKNQNYKEYLMEQLFFAYMAIVASVIAYFVCDMFPYGGLLALIIRAGIAVLIAGTILLLGIRVSKRWIDVSTFLKRIVMKK